MSLAPSPSLSPPQLCRSLEDGGFRLASKRDLALSSALQSASQRVLRSEVVVDESCLVDLITRPNDSETAASTRVLVFWKGARVEERGGGLFFEKLDYLQGEALSTIIRFWKDLARSSRDSMLGAWASVEDGLSSAVQGSRACATDIKSSLEAQLVQSMQIINVTRLDASIGISDRLASSNSVLPRLGSLGNDTGVASADGGRVFRIRSRRVGSLTVMTPDEVVRQGSTRFRASRRRGARGAAGVARRALARWGLVSSENRPLEDFMAGGSWAACSGKLAFIQTAAMKTAFSLAMRRARGNLTDVEASYWRVLLSAFLRPVLVLDPAFDQVVVIYARASHAQDAQNAQPLPLEGLWTDAASGILGSIDPGLPSALGFSPRAVVGSANVSGLLSGATQYLDSRRGVRSSVDDAQPAPGDPDTGVPQPPSASARTPEQARTRGSREQERAGLGVSLLAYDGVKVQNLRTLFPDRQLRFRPLDSLKLDLVTVFTFVSIAVTKLKFDDEISGIVAVVSASVWSVGVYYRIQARRNEYELETSRKLVERLSARKLVERLSPRPLSSSVSASARQSTCTLLNT